MDSSFLVITGHDPRSARKANVHFIAAELALRGTTRVFSVGFSRLSKLRGRDPRLGLESHANVVEAVDGIEVFLWMPALHPFNPRLSFLQAVSPLFFELYRRSAPEILRKWVSEATVIFVESGIGVLFIDDVKHWNPNATLIYIASDDMATIAVDPYLLRVFDRAGGQIDGARLPSRRLAASMPPGCASFFVPHGIDPSVENYADPSPYDGGINAVSVGSMLFDPGFFHVAAEAFPEVNFHVIGSGSRSTFPSNARVYGEIPFNETLPFLKHARLGIAAYRRANLPYYLCDTSMKLMQYEYFGIPSVCPTFVIGSDHPTRFGYEPGDPESIVDAIRRALLAPVHRRTKLLDWGEVTDRLLSPSRYADTVL